MTALLSIEDLHVHLDTPAGPAHVLNGVTFEVNPHEIVGLIGETGAGKSLTAWSALGLLGTGARIVAGKVIFDGADMVRLSERQRRRIRGRELAVIVQNPRGALDPVRTVGRQIRNLNRQHRKVSRPVAARQSLDALRAVGIPDPGRRAKSYAHQLSGGMAQRVLIAMAMVNEPKLIIADEPTTGLDLTVQAQILDLLRARVRQSGSAVLLVTHDLGVVANYCDRVAVMFAGRIVEQAPVDELLANPRHPYTRALVASAVPDSEPDPPDLVRLPPGCHYAPRCPFATDGCRADVPFVEVGPAHWALCHFPPGAAAEVPR